MSVSIRCTHNLNDQFTDYSSGDIICTLCGMIVCSKLIDEQAEWRHFESSNRVDMRRASILCKGGAVYTSLCAAGDKQSRINLNRANNLIRTLEDRVVDACVNIIQDFAKRLNISDKIIDKAITIVLNAAKCDIAKNRSKETISAAVLYITCTTEGVPRTIQEISNATCVDKKLIGRMSALLMQTLGIRKDVIQPESLVHRICSLARIPFATGETARNMCLIIADKQLTDSHSPQTTAAACISLASDWLVQPLVLSELERSSTVSSASILKMKATLAPYRSLIAPPHLRETTAAIRPSKSVEEADVVRTSPSCVTELRETEEAEIPKNTDARKRKYEAATEGDLYSSHI